MLAEMLAYRLVAYCQDCLALPTSQGCFLIGPELLFAVCYSPFELVNCPYVGCPPHQDNVRLVTFWVSQVIFSDDLTVYGGVRARATWLHD